jgi:hypothetical protein
MGAQNIIGTATVYGTVGTCVVKTLAGADLIASSKCKLVAGSLTDEVQKTELKDGAGTIVGNCFSGRKHTATFEIIPTDTTLSGAKSACVLPDPGAKLTIAGILHASTGTILDGDWNYIGGGQVQTGGQASDPIKYTLPCERYGDSPTAQAYVSS